MTFTRKVAAISEAKGLKRVTHATHYVNRISDGRWNTYWITSYETPNSVVTITK